MRIVRFCTDDDRTPRYGIRHSDHIRELAGTPFGETVTETDCSFSLEEARLLAPSTPTKIVAVGLNYRDHAAELGMALPEEPLLFLKPPSSVIGPGEPIRTPAMSGRVDYEAELALVMGQRTRHVSPDDAGRHILGFTCLNDVTARDLQRKDVQFTRSKSFDTFCPVGPWIETGLDPSDCGVQCLLNGEVRQSSRTSQLIHTVPDLVAFVSRIMTLEPGDIVSTGTPSGIGPMKAGDSVTVKIEGIGELTNPVTR